jgi:hypothetical protein
MKVACFGCQYLNPSALIYTEMTRGNMREHKPFGEGKAINQADDTYGGKHNYLAKPISLFVCAVFCPDKLTRIHYAALGHNKYKFNSTLKAALMFKGKGMNGEMANAY